MTDTTTGQPPAGTADGSAPSSADAGTANATAAADPSKSTGVSLVASDAADAPAPDAEAGDTAPAQAQAPEPVIPETYEFKLPEGQTVDAKAVEALTPVFKDLKLTQESAQKLVEGFAQYQAKAEVQRETDFQAFLQGERQNHETAIRKEWGHEFDANLKIAQRAIGRFASPAAKKILTDTGLDGNAEFLRMFLPIGRMIQEDNPPTNGAPAARKSAAEVLFGSGNA